jgi:hypothetical protein
VRWMMDQGARSWPFPRPPGGCPARGGGKTDAEGHGRSAYLSRETVRWLKIWLDHAGISEGTLFRRLIGQNQIGGPLNPGSIAPIFKRVAQWIGMPERFVEQVSGHSTRVGATQDLSALGIDLAAITQAGGWKSTRMPLQYAEKIEATRSGMARAAEKTGRTKRFPAAKKVMSSPPPIPSPVR